MLLALGHGTQQTVLEMPHRQIPALSQALHPPGAGLPPPGQQRIHIATAARQQTMGSQELRQRAVDSIPRAGTPSRKAAGLVIG